MEYERFFSSRARELQPAKIREVISLIKGENVIPMAGGMPNPESFPVDIISDLAVSVLDEKGPEALQYGNTLGYKPLREKVAKRFGDRYGLSLTHENVMIVTGASEGIFLGGRVFIEPKDDVIVSAPTYGTALRAFDNFNPGFVEIPLDDNGMKLGVLEGKIRAGVSPKFVYVIPSFQNPTGVTMSRKKREKLLALASKHDFLIMEDGPYNELRYEGEEIDPIISMDEEHRTLFLGSLSKVLAPGFRLGWIIGAEKLIRRLEIAKQSVNLCSSVFSQHVAHAYLESGKLDERIPQIKNMYDKKRQIILEALEDHMPVGTEWTNPKGGMFIWVTLPEKIDADEMLIEAVSRKIVYLPGYTAYASNGNKNTLRLNYTYPEDEQIKKGVRELGRLVKERH